jgi:uncharacterized membrane protein YeiH|tara:strand:+ start:689 stop:985 length:297 start_codon:yes stop_codon:yes gene_type:complete
MLEIVIVISAFCLGLRKITDTEMIGYVLRDLALNRLPILIAKPLILCCACMASIWGTIIYWSFYANSIWEWIFCIIAASFINSVLWDLGEWIKGQAYK